MRFSPFSRRPLRSDAIRDVLFDCLLFKISQKDLAKLESDPKRVAERRLDILSLEF